MKNKKDVSTFKKIVERWNLLKMSNMPFEGGSNFILFF
jgi:hypothetical protein